nr:MAG TPA: hypothetical protein [Caudoviricetes sp.]
MSSSFPYHYKASLKRQKRRQHKLAALFLSHPLPQRTSNNFATS